MGSPASPAAIRRLRLAAAVCEAIEAGPANSAPSMRCRARHYRHARRRRPNRCTARPRPAPSLSDNLKPGADRTAPAGGSWRRLRHCALQSDQPARPWQLGRAFECLTAILGTTGDFRSRRRPPGRAHRVFASRCRGQGRHGDLHHHRLAGNQDHQAQRQASAGAAFGNGSEVTTTGEARPDGFGENVRQGRSADHHHFDAQRPRRLILP